MEHDTTVLSQAKPRPLGGPESPLRVVSEWPRPRYLNLLGRPIYELFPLCQTCPPLFRQLGDAVRVVSASEFKQRLDAGLNTIDEDVLSRLSSVLPPDDYLPLLLRLWPRLIIPGEPGDYFTNERWRTFEHDPVDSEDVASGPYYRGTSLRLGPEDSLFEFVMPLVSPSSNDAARVQHYKEQILEASLGLLPRDVRRDWGGSVGVDATLVRSFARAEKRIGSGQRKRGAREVALHSADPDAAYYVREPDARDEGQSSATDKIAWGREATLVVSAPDDPDQPNFPSVVVGMAPLHKPGTAVGTNGDPRPRQCRRPGSPSRVPGRRPGVFERRHQGLPVAGGLPRLQTRLRLPLGPVGGEGELPGLPPHRGRLVLPLHPRDPDRRHGRLPQPQHRRVDLPGPAWWSVGSTWLAPRPSPTPRATSGSSVRLQALGRRPAATSSPHPYAKRRESAFRSP